MREPEKIDGIWVGAAAMRELVRAFYEATDGLEIQIYSRIEAGDTTVLILHIEEPDTTCALRANELHMAGRTILQSLGMAHRMGASPVRVNDLRMFAECLIRCANEARGIGPYGVH